MKTAFAPFWLTHSTIDWSSLREDVDHPRACVPHPTWERVEGARYRQRAFRDGLVEAWPTG